MRAARAIREALAAYDEARDLIQIGAYAPGSNPRLDATIRVLPEINNFLKQDVVEGTDRQVTLARMRSIAAML
jgi:flagellar biosynthesis/type III secretory pathway ATPase